MHLYEIDAELEALIDRATGEVQEDCMDDFLRLIAEKESALEQMALAYKNRAALLVSLKAEKKAMEERIKALSARNDRLENYISLCLNGRKLETARVRVSFRKTPESVRILGNEQEVIHWLEDSDQVAYWKAIRYKKPEIDKAELKRLIKEDGVSIPGVMLESGVAMSIK